MFTADFETTTDINDCRVWAWALCEIYNTDNFIVGTNIESFIEWCEKTKHNEKIMFHNLKFDGSFIISYLLRSGYKWVPKAQKGDKKVFTTLISDKGLFYSITIHHNFKSTKKHHTTTFEDSLKVLPFSVEKIAKDFDLPIKKLEIDYTEFRSKDHQLTPEEVDYIRNDVTIMALALGILYREGLTKMTTAANALTHYKSTVSPLEFRAWFPAPYYDKEVRQAYKGGWTYLKPEFSEVDLGEGIVLDVNSLYPSVMYYKPLPYGEPRYFDGQYKPNRLYNVYIQLLRCIFEIKPGHLPTIQLKNTTGFIETEYLTSSNNDLVTLCLTSVDLELFFKHYNVYAVEYLGGYEFKSQCGMFTEYIDYWMNRKKEATIEKNGAKRQIAKLQLNSLYGKYAVNPICYSKIPYLDEAGIVRYKLGEQEERKPLYIPVGAFITAYARNITISAAQANFDRFVYADTDSLHLIGTALPEGLEIDDVKLGAWKHESTFKRARFLRSKSYIEEIINDDGTTEMKVTCAGLPHISHKPLPDDEYQTRLLSMTKECFNGVTWVNFHKGSAYIGKLQPVSCVGGIVLKDVDFTIKL